MLELKKIKKDYQIGKNEVQKVLKGIDLKFKRGEFVCIYGESGSGKSTLLNIIGSLDTKYEGNVLLDKENLRNINLDDYRKDKVGFIFQSFNLIPYLNVFENVMLMLDTVKLSKDEKIEKVLNSLDKVGLLDHKYKKINELSGGQKQRVGIARAIISEPDIILADEPTGALDSKSAENILKILSKISKEGKLVIVVSHSNNVKKYASRVITIVDGKISSDEKKIVKNSFKKKNKCLKRELNTIMCIKLGISNIIKNLKRNILLIIGSSVGIIGILMSLYIGDGVKKYINEELKKNINPLSFSVFEKGKNNLYDVKYYSKEEINRIKNIKHVKNIDKNISYTSAYIVYDDKKYDLVSFSSFSNIKHENIEEGSSPLTNEIILGEYLAKQILGNKKYNKIIDKNIEIYLLDSSKNEPTLLNKKLNVSGIYKNGKIDLINNSNFAYVNYETIENIYYLAGINLMPNELKIEIDSKENIDYVKKKMNKLGFEITNAEDYTDAIFNYLDIATFILSCFSILSLVVSCIMMIIVFSINVLERTKEIGIFRSLGYRSLDIKKIFQSEAILLGLLSGIFSIIISIIISILVNNITKEKLSINIVSINTKYMLFGILISIFVCIIGNIIPSNKASKLNIIDALRCE